MLLLLGTIGAYAQTVFDKIDESLNKLPRKATIVYPYATWCGGNKTDIESLHEVLSKYRSKYNFIVLYDSTRTKKMPVQITDLKPDTFIPVNSFYPKIWQSRKEMKTFAGHFYNKYHEQTGYMGPASIFILKCDRTLLKSYVLENRVVDLEKDLQELVNNCEK